MSVNYIVLVKIGHAIAHTVSCQLPTGVAWVKSWDLWWTEQH
jgi:hypothetical protein